LAPQEDHGRHPHPEVDAPDGDVLPAGQLATANNHKRAWCMAGFVCLLLALYFGIGGYLLYAKRREMEEKEALREYYCYLMMKRFE
jgi:hypothetical protein